MSLDTCKVIIQQKVTPIVNNNPTILDTALRFTESFNCITSTSHADTPGYSGYVLFARQESQHVADRGNIAIGVFYNPESDHYGIRCYFPHKSRHRSDVSIATVNIAEADLATDLNTTMRTFTESYS